METLGMLVLETDGPYGAERRTVLKLCSQEEAASYARLLRDQEALRLKLEKSRKEIHKRHTPPVTVSDSAVDSAVDSAGKSESISSVRDRLSPKRSDIKYRSRYAWYPWIAGVTLESWEGKADEDYDEE